MPIAKPALIWLVLFAPAGWAQQSPLDNLLASLDDPAKRRDACLQLMARGKAATPALAKRLNHKDRFQACMAGNMLARMGSEALGAVGALRDLRQAREPWREHLARFVLRRILVQRIIVALDRTKNEAVIFDPRGQELRRVGTGQQLYDVDYLDGDNLLLCELKQGRVVELDRAGKVVWEFKGCGHPLESERLPDGNTLIAGGKTGKVLEVDPQGKVVWSWAGTKWPIDADRLPWGNTLVCDAPAGSIYEVDPDGKVVRQLRFASPVDVCMQPDGRILAAGSSTQAGELLSPEGETLRSFPAGNPKRMVKAVAFGQDGMVVLGTTDGVVVRDAEGTLLWKKLKGSTVLTVQAR